MEQECKDAASENRVPFSDRIPARSLPAVSDVAEDVFTAADLSATEGPIATGAPYTVPGTGKRLWVFPISSEDYELMLRWAVTLDALDPEDEDPRKAGRYQAVNNAVLTQEMQIHQVILCCRTGPTRAHPRCFKREDAPALRKRLGYAVVGEIVALSDRLTGNDENLGPGVRRFFASVQTVLQSWSSAFATWDGCPTGLRASTERLVSLISRASMRGSLDSGTLDELGEV